MFKSPIPRLEQKKGTTLAQCIKDSIKIIVWIRLVCYTISQLVIMKAFSQLIEQVGVAVRPHIGSLLEQIPGLWAEAEGDNSSILQCVIISTLTHVINSLGDLSSQLHHFVLPIIQHSIDMQKVGVVTRHMTCMI